MEENTAKLFEEQLPNTNHLTRELFQSKTPKQGDWDAVIPKQCAQDPSEEETPRIYLDKLKKENFTLRTSIKAWQTTLETKSDEFKKADLKLEELYNEIWSERERFCSKQEKFNQEYGILSNWWEMQVKVITKVENTRGKASEDQKCKQEIEILEKEIGELKNKIEELQARKRGTTAMPTTAEGHSISSRNESETNYPRQVTKKVKFSEVVEEYNIGRTVGEAAHDIYSVVDLEKEHHIDYGEKHVHKCGKCQTSYRKCKRMDEQYKSRATPFCDGREQTQPQRVCNNFFN